jgi:hypothetical protein
VPDCTGLTVDTAAADIHQYVQFLVVGRDNQRLLEYISEGLKGEVFFQTASVYLDSRCAFPNIYPGYRGFTASGAVG